MLVNIKENYHEVSKEAARIVAELVRKKPNCVLGFATGSTPLGLYKVLIRMHKEEGLDFSKVTTFNLDEYVGLLRNITRAIIILCGKICSSTSTLIADSCTFRWGWRKTSRRFVIGTRRRS